MAIQIQKSNGTNISVGSGVVRDGLRMYYDVGNDKSYPGTGTTLTNITPYPQIEVAPTATLNSATVNGDGHLSFDGTSRVTLSENFTMRKEGGTLMWWMATDSPSTNQVLFSIGTGPTNPYLQLIEYHQTKFYGEVDTNCNNFDSPTFTTFTAGEWRHVAVRFLNNESHWYIDGQNIGETPDYGDSGGNCGNGLATELEDDLTMRYIGGSGGYGGQYDGLMNQIMLYNRGLSDEEVFQNYRVTEHRYN